MWEVGIDSFFIKEGCFSWDDSINGVKVLALILGILENWSMIGLLFSIIFDGYLPKWANGSCSNENLLKRSSSCLDSILTKLPLFIKEMLLGFLRKDYKGETDS